MWYVLVNEVWQILLSCFHHSFRLSTYSAATTTGVCGTSLQWCFMSIMVFQIIGNLNVCLTVFRLLTTTEMSKLHINGPLWGESTGFTSGFTSQRASNAESISMSLHHQGVNNLFNNHDKNNSIIGIQSYNHVGHHRENLMFSIQIIANFSKYTGHYVLIKLTLSIGCLKLWISEVWTKCHFSNIITGSEDIYGFH